MTERDDRTWLRDLSEPGAAQEVALADLRCILMARVRTAWAGRESADDALLEDAIQNSLMQILSKLDTFRGKSRFITWATTIVIHTVLTEIRRVRWSNVSLEAACGSVEQSKEAMANSAGPEDRLIRVEFLAFLNELIRESLTDRQRTVILAELNGMPLEEIARRVGTNRNAVYKVAHDARRALKSQLEAAGYDASDITKLTASRQEDRRS